MMRALVFDFASDPMALDIPDQYMFGPAFLVNPVTTQGATSRSVYLPASTTWYDFWTGSTQAGGQTITAAAPIERLPLYVQAGAIVPMGPIMQYATEMPCDPIEIQGLRRARMAPSPCTKTRTTTTITKRGCPRRLPSPGRTRPRRCTSGRAKVHFPACWRAARSTSSSSGMPIMAPARPSQRRTRPSRSPGRPWDVTAP